VRVEAAGLNHAETLIRSGSYAVRLPFPYPLGGEGAGVVVATGPDVSFVVGARVCWGAVLGSCASLITAPASMFVPLPDGLSFEDGACLAVAGLTAGGLARVWPLKGHSAVVWGAAGAVGRMLVAILADQGVDVIGIAGCRRVDCARAAGANHIVDRANADVREAVRAYTGGRGVAAVFDRLALRPMKPVCNSSRRGALHALFPGSLSVTKYNGMRWVEGLDEFTVLIAEGLALAARRPAVISDIAGRFSLDRVAEAVRAHECLHQPRV
jgi:NADPH2:quinone reductase